MKKQQFTRDELAKFLFAQSDKIENYTFDLCHDIAKIVNYGYDCNNYRDEHGQIITNKPVQKTFIFFVRKYGSWLFEENNTDLINHVERNQDAINKYKIVITPNCDYLHNIEFAQITKLK